MTSLEPEGKLHFVIIPQDGNTSRYTKCHNWFYAFGILILWLHILVKMTS